MRIAVVDLGTNTFNLLIAEAEGNKIKTLYNEKISVKLGRGGIGDNIILPDAIDRALTALTAFNQTICNFLAEKVIALGTSVLRTSQNSCEFLNTVKEKLGINIEIISGNREAELIYKGVLQTLEDVSGNFLILDIGGGSNEFILADKKNIIWKRSFKLGMARLNDKFRPSDPVKSEEIIIMNDYFANELKPLFKVFENNKVDILVGAEGAFESFYNIMGHQNNPSYRPIVGNLSKEIRLDNFYQLHNFLLKSTVSDRMKLKGLEPYRVEMIVPASVFVNFLLDKLKINKMLISPNSMKEGAALETLNILQ
jgi:exopolyphosphatase / guanosine-5'-triphosphate,3'-diphosphate pyrophosphatase